MNFSLFIHPKDVRDRRKPTSPADFAEREIRMDRLRPKPGLGTNKNPGASARVI